MARKRMIDPEFWSDEKLAGISRDARLLFIGTWNFADDRGNLRYSPMKLKAQVFPFDGDVNVATLLEELFGIGVLIRYSVNGDEYIHVKSLLKYQQIQHPSKPIHPEPEGGLNEDSMSTTTEENRIEDNVCISSPDIQQVFDFWNTQEKTITHRVLNERTKTAIKVALKTYDVAEICGAIDTWLEIAHSPEYWFSHTAWTLQHFLQRGLERFADPNAYDAHRGKGRVDSQLPRGNAFYYFYCSDDTCGHHERSMLPSPPSKQAQECPECHHKTFYWDGEVREG